MYVLLLLLQQSLAEFRQLVDPYIPTYLDASTTPGSGYVELTGTNAQFDSHHLGSSSYTITLWVQEKEFEVFSKPFLHLQQAGSTTSQGTAGDRILLLQKSDGSLETCLDTSNQSNYCHTTNLTGIKRWSWTHYFVSVCESSQDMKVCYTTWRGTTQCDIVPISGTVYTFDLDSIAYLGGSPYTAGLLGKIVDVRLYDTSWYLPYQAENMALNRRCAKICSNSCWGPDETSCNGLEFLHPYYSTYLDTSTTLNEGKLQFEGTDLKFKGHDLNSQEMSFSWWFYAPLDQSNHVVFSLMDETSALIIKVYVTPTKLQGWIMLDSTVPTVVEVASSLMTNKWVHIGFSISQANKKSIMCATFWGYGSVINCDEIAIPSSQGNVKPFLPSGTLYLGSNDSSIASLGGRLVDFRFFANQAFTESIFQEIVDKAAITWAPSCGLDWWGPDTYSCSSYIQLVDPRFSTKYISSTSPDYTEFLGSDPRTTYYSFGSQNYSVALWLKRDASYTPSANEIIVKVHSVQSCCTTGSRQPGILLSPFNTINVGVIDSLDNQWFLFTPSLNGPTGTGWTHFSVGVSPSDLTLCWTEFDSDPSNMTASCETVAVSNTIGWDPTQPQSAIWVGDHISAGADQFQGRIVDARYYPNQTLYQTDIEDIISIFSCMGDTEHCTGPDHTSVKYMRLTEKNFEYSTYSTGGVGKAYFEIPGTHVNFISDTYNSDYQVSAWVVGEDRLTQNQYIYKFQTDSGNCWANGEAKRIPSAHITSAGKLKGWADATTSTNLWAVVAPEANYFQFKKAFNVQTRVCSEDQIESCLILWNGSSICDTFSISGFTPLTFDSTGWITFGGSNYMYNDNLRITNLIYFPFDWSSDPLTDFLECDVQCNAQWYGPGMNSWIYDKPLYISDEYILFRGDGSAQVEKQGNEAEFEGHFMQYATYSICTWFYLKAPLQSGDTCNLLAMTSVQNDLSITYRHQNPLLNLVYGSQLGLYAQIVDQSDVSHAAVIQSVSIDTWYLAWVVVSQVDATIELHLSTYDGSLVSDTVTFTDQDSGYFDENSYLYYGGTGSQWSFDGYMLDIRFWDTKALSVTEISNLVAEKPCHPLCATCFGPSQGWCLSCVSPWVLWDSYWVANWPTGTIPIGGECLTPPCFTGCDSCSDIDANSCTSCSSGWYLQPTGNSCATTWPQQYYKNQSTGVWNPCHSDCKTWSSGTQLDCLQCQDGYYLNSTVCEQCNSSCLTWSGSTASSWLSCVTSKLLIDGECTLETQCPTLQYQSGNTCLACDDSCSSCESYAANCATWNSPKYIDVDSTCQLKTCPSKEYLDSSYACQNCTTNCDLCENSQTCTSWSQYSTLQSGQCLCWPGFEMVFSNWLEICGDGKNMGQLECDDGNLENRDGCSADWLVEAYWIWSGGSNSSSDTCIKTVDDYEGPILNYYVSETNDIIIEFSEKPSSFGVNDVQIDLAGVEYKYDLVQLDDLTYKIKMQLNTSVDEGTEITVTISKNVTDAYDQPVENPAIKLNLNSIEITAQTEKDAAKNSSTATKSSIVIIALTAFIGGAPNLLWGLLNNLTIVAFFPLLNIQAPEFVNIFCSNLLGYDVLPVIYPYVFDEDEYVGQDPFDAAQTYMYKNTVFLEYGNEELLFWFITLLLFPIFKMLSNLKSVKISAYFSKACSNYKYQIQHRTFIQIFAETGTAAWLQIGYLNFSNFAMALSGIAAIIFAIATIVYPVWIFGMIYSQYEKIANSTLTESFEEKHHSLFYELRKNQNLNTYLYYFYFLIRRLIFIFTLIFLHEYPNLQVLITWAHTIIFLVWIVNTKPLAGIILNWLSIFSEMSTVIILSLFTLYLWDFTMDDRISIGYYIIVSTLLVVGVNIIVTFGLVTHQWWQSKRVKELNTRNNSLDQTYPNNEKSDLQRCAHDSLTNIDVNQPANSWISSLNPDEEILNHPNLNIVTVKQYLEPSSPMYLKPSSKTEFPESRKQSRRPSRASSFISEDGEFVDILTRFHGIPDN